MVEPEKAPRPSRAIPAAIAFAGVAIGLGLYFGLRDRAPTEPSTRVVWESRPSAVAPSAAFTVLPPPGVTPEMQETVTRAASRAVSEAHARLVEQCWKPSAAQNPEPAALTLRARFLFSPEGQQLDFSVADTDAASRHDFVECVRRAGVRAELEGLGTTVGTQLEIAFP